MGSFRAEHVFNCSEATFWDKVFFDDEYNRRQFSDVLHFSLWKEVERRDDGNQIHRRVQAAPPLGDVPGPLKAVIGDSAGYEERGVFDKQKRRYTVKVTPNKMADKITIEIAMWTEPSGENKLRRIVEGTVTAKIFGVGGMLEKKMISDLERSYEKTATFTNQFIQEKGL
jgi:hypothetical protein